MIASCIKKGLHTEVPYYSLLVELEIGDVCHRYTSLGNLMA